MTLEEIVKKSVKDEYQAFQVHVLAQKSKFEIFNMAFQIMFYTEVSLFVEEVGLSDFEEDEIEVLNRFDGNILGNLFHYYCETTGTAVSDSDQVLELINDFIQENIEEDDE